MSRTKAGNSHCLGILLTDPIVGCTNLVGFNFYLDLFLGRRDVYKFGLHLFTDLGPLFCTLYLVLCSFFASKSCCQEQSTKNKAQSLWCERGDSNPHTLRYQILSLARLPIPPLSHL